MGMSVQFKDARQVIDAFTSRQVEAWSLWCGKQFMFKGVGLESLETIINTLSDGATNATYTLKVYEDIEDEKKIKNNTPDDGSFNFRLNDDRQIIRTGQIAGVYRQDEIMKKLEAMEQRFESLEERDEPAEKSAIGQLLEHPAISGVIPGLVELLLKSITGVNSNQNMIQKTIGAVPVYDQSEMNAVLKELAAYDPDILQHLKRLLEIAKENNQLFNTVINSL